MKESIVKILPEFAAPAGVTLSEEQIGLLADHAALMAAWNRTMNLTRITDPEEIVVKHLLDSLIPAAWLPDTGPAADIGSGPGYPGIPLKIVHPGLLMELVESAGKKANFLSTVAASLGVPGLEALRARWEDLPREPQRLGRYRLLVMRAVRPEPAHLKILAASLLQPGGIFAWWGGPEGEAEALRVTAQAGKCPVRYHASHRYELPGLKGGRCLCTWIRKG